MATSSTRVEKASRGAGAYARWSADLPDEMTTAVAFMNVPPLPRAARAAAGQVRHIGAGLLLWGAARSGRGDVSSLARSSASPIMDTFGAMPSGRWTGSAWTRPTRWGYTQHVRDARRPLAGGHRGARGVAGAGSDSPLIMLELRHLGGALARLPADLSPMGTPRLQVLMYGIGGHSTPEMAEGGPGAPSPRGRGDAPVRDRRHLRNFMEFGGATQNEYSAAYAPRTGSAWSSSKTATTHRISSASTATSRLLWRGSKGLEGDTHTLATAGQFATQPAFSYCTHGGVNMIRHPSEREGVA